MRAAAVAPYLHQAFEALHSAFDDSALPLAEAVEAIEEFRPEIRHSRSLQKQMFPTLAAALRGRCADQVSVLALAASLHTDIAWAFRGGGYYDKVTEDGWRGLEGAPRLGVLPVRTRLEPRPHQHRHSHGDAPRRLLSLPSQEARMETWFRRAMELDPNCYDASTRRLGFSSRSGTAPQQFLAFGRECITCQNLGRTRSAGPGRRPPVPRGSPGHRTEGRALETTPGSRTTCRRVTKNSSG